MSKCCRFLLRGFLNQRAYWRWARVLAAFLVGLFVFAMGLCVIALAVDRFNVAKRSLDALAPYSSVLPWIVVMVVIVYIIHQPGVLPRLLCLLDRIKNLGPVGFDPSPRAFSKEEKQDFAEILTAAIADAMSNRGLTRPGEEKTTTGEIPAESEDHQAKTEVEKH